MALSRGGARTRGGTILIRNTVELVLEFITRRDFIALYLGAVGLWFLWLAFSGLRLGRTRGFGWRREAVGQEAPMAGRWWLSLAAVLLIFAAVLWWGS